MAEDAIRCPKCSHEQTRGTECEACGVIFGRYVRYQKRKKQEREAVVNGSEEKRGKSILVSALQLILVAAIAAGGTYWYLRPGKEEVVAPVAQKVKPQVEPEVMSSPPQPRPAEAHKVVESQPVRGSSIERARKATVSIETPWGTGSGFFINESYIVTNRHVVEMDQDKLAEFRRKVESSRELVELEKKKLRELRSRMHTTVNRPTRNQIAIVVEERERELNKVLPKLEEAERRLARMEENLRPRDIKIVLADGSAHQADYMLMSDKYDLALMSLIANNVNYLQRPPENYGIRQGDKVFTIGSPVGLRNTVTSGIFSGYRKDMRDGTLLLQTDAPINPGNSGGPLIDEKGFVRGVNTMILQNTEGIGFAIPIETVYEEFGSSLF